MRFVGSREQGPARQTRASSGALLFSPLLSLLISASLSLLLPYRFQDHRHLASLLSALNLLPLKSKSKDISTATTEGKGHPSLLSASHACTLRKYNMITTCNSSTSESQATKVNHTKFESPKGSVSKYHIIPRTYSRMRVLETASSGANQQLGDEDRHYSFSKYFSIKSVAVLIAITISLLILPLVLPPLAPPPSLLLLLPIGILIVLLILALKYSSTPHTAALHM